MVHGKDKHLFQYPLFDQTPLGKEYHKQISTLLQKRDYGVPDPYKSTASDIHLVMRKPQC